MTPLLTEHAKWSPSIKRFYGKYHSTARFVGLQWQEPIRIGAKWDGEYRTRVSYTYRTLNGRFSNTALKDITIYTSKIDLLEELVKDSHYETKLDYIATPRDPDHQSDLENTEENLVFRSKLYYSKYEYKVEANVNYWRNPPDSNAVAEAIKYVEENFKDTRIVYTDGRTHMPRSRYMSPIWGIGSGQSKSAAIPKFPTLYTNDTASLFLLKLSWGGDLNLVTERVVIV